ncbi:MAG: GTP-binding protein [Candidatus Kariarchaeaceae archaeon]|jgi:small GTP-binding protein
MAIKYKIIILGDAAVGKTSLRQRFMGKGFQASYGMTIGADFAAYRLNVNDRDYVLNIFDLAGQQRFNDLNKGYYAGTNGAVLVFDVTRPETYENLPNWIEQLVNNMRGKVCPIVLVGNKADLRADSPSSVPKEIPENYVKELSQWSGFDVSYYDSSALTGDNVDTAFRSLVNTIDHYVGMI